jgi:hypothetical protein
MGRESLSIEELAVLLAAPADGSVTGNGVGSEAEALRRRLTADVPGVCGTAGGRPSVASASPRTLLDDWPGPARLAGRLAAVWSGLLRNEVAVSVLHVAPGTFGEFLLMSRYPTFLATATHPLGSPVLAVEVPLAVVCPAIRCMLGGPLEAESESVQALTPIEQRLAKRLVGCLVPEALAVAGDREPSENISLAVHDRLPRVSPAWARASAASVQFQIKLGILSGLARCCVPWAT